MHSQPVDSLCWDFPHSTLSLKWLAPVVVDGGHSPCCNWKTSSSPVSLRKLLMLFGFHPSPFFYFTSDGVSFASIVRMMEWLFCFWSVMNFATSLRHSALASIPSVEAPLPLLPAVVFVVLLPWLFLFLCVYRLDMPWLLLSSFHVFHRSLRKTSS